MSVNTNAAGLLLCVVVLPVWGGGELPKQRHSHEAIIRTVYDLAKLTPAQARRLHGHKITFHIVVDTDPYRDGKHDIYGLEGDEEVERSLFVPAGMEVDDEAMLEVEFRLIDHAPRVIGNTAFVGFTEYRLLVQ